MRHARPIHVSMASVWILGVFLLLLGSATSDCECGYSITTESDGEQHIFTDLLETDFIHVDVTGDGRGAASHGWAPQVYNITSQTSRGPFGEFFDVKNVVSDTIKDQKLFDGPGSLGMDAGLHLVVRNEMVDSNVPVAEISTTGLHYFYGTFRAGIKTTDVPGTCSAFFWVRVYMPRPPVLLDTLDLSLTGSDSPFPPNSTKTTRRRLISNSSLPSSTGPRRYSP